MSTITQTHAPAARVSRRPRLPSWVPPAALGSAATILTAIGAGTPSMWGDEAASVMSAQRSWASLGAMLQNVDAVHGLYYAFLHVWIDLFGASALSVRMPSAIAVGVTIAGVYALCVRLTQRRVAVIAALTCIIIPRVSFMAAEARSAAIATALVTWLTVLLLDLMKTRRLGWRHIMYAAGVFITIHLFLYTVLLLVVHVIVLLYNRPARATLIRWGVAAASALTASVPFILFASTQRGQIAFLSKRDTASPGKILIDQWFAEPAFAAVAWSLVVIAVFAWWRARPRATVGQVNPDDRRETPSRDDNGALFVFAATWLALPAALLLIAHLVIGPLYTGRYLSFSAPAAAILIALGIDAIRPRWMRSAAAVLLLAVALPIHVVQRGPYAKFGNDWAEVSQIIGQRSQPGDGVIFDENVRPSRKPRLALHLYPEGFTEVRDLTLIRPYDQTDHLWDEIATLAETETETETTLTNVDRVWVVSRSELGTAGDETTLIDHGFTLEDATTVNQNTIRLYTKETQ